MGNFLSNAAVWTGSVISNWFRPRQVGGVWFYGIGDNSSFKDLDYLNAFNQIPELNAVINYKARAFSSGRIKAINPKTGEEIGNDPIVNLLKNPNWFQAEKEFLRQTKIFHEIFGNEYLFSFFGVGFKPINAKAIYTIPPNLVECKYSDKSPFFNTAEKPGGITYKYKTNQKESDINIEQLIHLNDNRVTTSSDRQDCFLLGESKMKGLTPAINNIKMAYETRGVILKRRGAMGILSNDGSDAAGQIPLSKEDRDDVQNQYRQYGGLENQDNIIITNAKLKWQQMSIAPDKLGLFQETQEDFFRMCDAYGVPQELFSNSKGTTFENQKHAETRMYSNTTIPEANEWIGALQQYFYPDGNVILCMDYSHLAVFQEDIELSARTLSQMVSSLSTALKDKAITIEEYQMQLNKYGLSVGNKPQ